MADVFISYKREDRQVAERLSDTLAQLGFEVWWDFELLSGDSFRKTIRAVIDQCATAVVLWSRKSVESSFVLDEAAHAQRLGKLFPVRIDDAEPPMGFGQLHAIDLSEWDGELSHHGFQGLVKALEQRIGRRARLGSGSVSQKSQTSSAELDAFKTAQVAGTVAALRTFLESFPNSVFATFVRDQIDSLAVESKVVQEHSTPRRAEPINAVPGSTGTVAPLGRRWKVIVAGVAILTLVGIGYGYYSEAQRREEQSRREQADAARIAAERRARQLEEQAALERGARERAEKAQAESRAEDQAKRDRIASVQATAFNEAVLNRDVRLAVDAARKAARTSDAVAEKARTAAITAENAADLARNGVTGTISLTFEGGSYLGEGSGKTRDGYGVSTYREPSKSAGNRFSGQYRNNLRAGLGVYAYGTNASNVKNLLRREGEYAQDKPTGMGVVLWVNGDRYAGLWRDGIKSGNAVLTYADGRRYEGGFAGDKRNGPGVLWSSEGRVMSAGLWKDGDFAKPLAP